MDIETMLRSKIKTGEVIAVYYRNEEQGYSLRKIVPVSIIGNDVAVMCYTTNSYATLKIENVELANNLNRVS